MKDWKEAKEFAKSFAEHVDLDKLFLSPGKLLNVMDVEVRSYNDLLRYAMSDKPHKYKLPVGFFARRRFNLLENRWEPAIVRGGRKFKEELKLWTGLHFACPYPLSFDPYAGFCPFRCLYCYAMGSSLPMLRGLFDGAPELPVKVVEEKRIEELLLDGHPSSITVGFRLADWLLRKDGYTIKVGLRGEVFSGLELKYRRMERVLEVLRSSRYKLAINTKSVMWWTDRNYRERLLNVADKVVMIMSITAPRMLSDTVKRFFEPGAPSIEERFRVLKEFTEVGGKAIVFFVPPIVFMRGYSTTELVDAFLSDLLEAYPDSYPWKVVSVQGWRTTGVPIQQYGKMALAGFSPVGLMLDSSSWFWGTAFRWWVYGRARLKFPELQVATNEPILRWDWGADEYYMCEGIENMGFRYNPAQWLEVGRWMHAHPGKPIGEEDIFLLGGFGEEWDDYFKEVASGSIDYLAHSQGARVLTDGRVVYDSGVDWEVVDNSAGLVLRWMMLMVPDYVEQLRGLELVSPLLEDRKTYALFR